MATAETKSTPKPSGLENIKESSDQLRGTIALELAKDTTHFADADKQLLKFHGTYQQDDRDARKKRRKDGVGKHYMFMVRCRIPGGKVTADQYLTLDDLADQYANGTLRITSRQGIQFHGVLKKNLHATIAGINETLLSTLGACGDVERNVMAPPAPLAWPVYEQLQQTANAIAQHLAPRTTAYHDIWMNGTKVDVTTNRFAAKRQPILEKADKNDAPLAELPSEAVRKEVIEKIVEKKEILKSIEGRVIRTTEHRTETKEVITETADGVEHTVEEKSEPVRQQVASASANGTGTPGENTTGESDGTFATEPIYGKHYLPRKFKTGLAIPEDNTVDIYSQDLGFLAVIEDGKIAGYNVLAGGGMGMTHGKAETFPHMARPICYVTPDQVIAAAEAMIKLFRDHGNRSDRKQARLKYVLHRWGVEKFREVYSTYIPFPLVPPKNVEVHGFPLHLGWHPQGDGQFYYGVQVESGRIKDEGSLRLRTALRSIVEKFKPGIRFTPMQDILLCNLPADAQAEIEKTLTDHGVQLPDHISPLRQHSLACPAIPTCGLAISESERMMPDILEQLEAELTNLGLEKEKISVRVTGCPNGCVRPYQSDIGIVGRSGDKYALFVGGNILGTRLNFALKDLVPRGEIVPTLSPLLRDYKENRKSAEGFGDFCHRVGVDEIRLRVRS